MFNEGLQKIDKKAFEQCNPLERISFPSTITDIVEGAFYNCNSLREVVLNEGLVNVGEYAFNNCTSLTSITLPSTVIEIRRNAFSKCSSLKKVVLKEGLVRIKENAFFVCSSLKSITIPSSLVDIGKEAFSNCIRLSELVCSGALPSIEWNTFCGCPLLERISFPNMSSRLDNIIQCGHVDAQNKVQQYINRSEMVEVEWERGGMIYISVNATRRRDGWNLVERYIHQIDSLIKYYEMKEATTLFELALWKAKIDQVGGINRHDRDAYRVDVPGPVKDTILQYLL